MKKLLLILSMFVCVASPSLAATENIFEGMGQKAFRGAVNIVSSPVEVPAQIIKGFRNGFTPIENVIGSKTVGTLLGFFRGFSHAGGRLSWGFLELAGFWTANPEDNEGVGIPLDAEYAWEEGIPYSIFEPDFSEGIKPIGRKFSRGLGNGLLGIAELPAQTLRGISEGSTAKGVLKGFWFWGSRSLYGFMDIASVLAPNPPDNPGYPFNGKWPWSVLNEEMED